MSIKEPARKHYPRMLCLQPRDWYCLELLYEHPNMTALQLDCLIKQRFPGMPYEANIRKPYKVSRDGLKRRRIFMQDDNLIGKNSFNFSLYTYFLKNPGKNALEDYSGQELYWTRRKLQTDSHQTLKHTVFLNDFYSALALSLCDTKFQIKYWRADSRVYKDVRVPAYTDSDIDTTRLEPDARFQFVRPNGKAYTVYVEADRSGGVHHKSKKSVFKPKTMLARYRRYWEIRKQSDKPMIVVTFSRSAQRAQNLQQTIRTSAPWDRHRTGMFWFAHDTWKTDWKLCNNLHLPVLDRWETAWNEPRNFLEN